MALTLRLARRAHDRGDRPRLPRPGADDRPAHRAREADARRGAGAVRGADAAKSCAARLPSVLEVVYLIFNEGYAATRGDEWMRPDAVRGRAAPGANPRRARPRRGGGARPGGADGAAGVARRARGSARRRAGAAARPGPGALGSPAHPPRSRRARTAPRPRQSARPVHAPGRDRRVPRAGARPATRPTGRGSSRSTTRSVELTPLAGRRAEPRGRGSMAFGPAAGLELVDALVGRAGASRLPPAPERSRRPPREAGPQRRGAGGVRARGAR